MRADASPSMGTGHIIRCLTLADRLSSSGWDIAIATRDLPPPLSEGIRARGYQLIGVSPEEALLDEPRLIGRALTHRTSELTVVDHYALGAEWHQAARAWSNRIMVIDDVAVHTADADLLLNQNLGESAEAYVDLVPAGSRLLIGPMYALLRPQFAEARDAILRTRRALTRLLVFLSGSDEHDVTAVAAHAAASAQTEIDVVVGAAYPHWERLLAWARGKKFVTVHRNIENMASLMARADLSIGAPSSASWERCCVGLPSILVTLAENQRRAAAALAAVGAAVDLGWYRDIDSSTLGAAVETLASSPDDLTEMSTSARAITDGMGAARVEQEIMRLIEGGPTRG